MAHNVRTLAAHVAPAGLMAVVKADGYNHGMVDIARTAVDAGASALGVATLGEAVALRDAGVTAPVTAWIWLAEGEDLGDAVARDITFGIPSVAHLDSVVAAATAAGRTVKVGLMVDTGLSRSGISPAEWPTALDRADAAVDSGKIEVTGLFSHLASADDPISPVTDLQERRFSARIEECRARGLDVPVNHIANTPAALSRVDLRHEMVRPGVGMYGVDPCAIPSGVDLRPAMTLRARVVTTRLVAAGEGVSYGHHWTAPVDTRTAVVALGYADGLPRALSGKFGVTVNGTWFPQIGRVCMDQIVIDLGPAADTDGPGSRVRPGDWAVIFGEGGRPVREIADAADTIDYEILTMPRGPRVARRTVPVQE
ncbi:MAG: alanine racemase [Corynebacterium provencense]|uniref:alanine racemase n=1 Tax=Corynebacterium provencense TaxID=1737425 RepID=UPI002989E4E2|nr:alanine racemase [Corynebacterium provencense]